MIAFLAATILMAGGAPTMQAAPDTAKPKLTAANTLICKSEPVLGTRLSTRNRSLGSSRWPSNAPIL